MPSHNIGQLPPAVTTWVIKGAFRAHFSNLWCLSIFLIVFFMLVGSLQSSVRISVVNGVLKWDSRSLHSLTMHTQGHLTSSWQVHQLCWNKLSLRSIAFARKWASFEAGRIWHYGRSRVTSAAVLECLVLLPNSPMSKDLHGTCLKESSSHTQTAAQGECMFLI